MRGRERGSNMGVEREREREKKKGGRCRREK
jgi:hypothetical protein